MHKTTCRLGGIIKHRQGIGFKVTFQDREQANYYKQMFYYILKSDYKDVENIGGYYDDKI